MPKRFYQAKKRYTAASHRHVSRVKRITKKPLFAIPFVICILFMLIICLGLFISHGGNPVLKTNDSNVVVLSHDKEEQAIPTTAKTVGELIKRLDIKINEGDVVEPSKDTDIIGDNFRVNIYRAVPVTIVDGDKKTFTYSAAATPRSIVRQTGVVVYPEDKLELLPTENFLTDSSIGERVVINRATPIAVNLYGTPTSLRTHATTVAELLKEKNIKLGDGDSVEPALNTNLSTTAQVFLIHKGTQIQTTEEAIAMPQQTIEDDSLSFGAVAIRQQGAPGKRLITYQINLQNGVEVGRTPIQSVVSQEPVTQIVAKGTHFDINSDKTSLMAAAGIAKSDYPYVDYIVTRESGWCYTKWQGQYGNCPAFHGAPTSAKTGYGLCQSTPGYKMASAGADWASNPVTQLKWCDGYAKARTFGSNGKGWYSAYQYWLANKHW